MPKNYSPLSTLSSSFILLSSLVMTMSRSLDNRISKAFGTVYQAKHGLQQDTEKCIPPMCESTDLTLKICLC